MIKQISKTVVFAILVAYFAMASLFFFNYGLPSLEGKIPQQMYSDSTTWENVTKYGLDAENIELIGIGGNLLGPALVLLAFNFDRIFIHFFNVLIMLLSFLIVLRNFPVNRLYFLLAFLSSPLLFFSLFGVNKEIFVLLATVCLAVLIRKRSWTWFFLTLTVSLLARWQFAFFVILVFWATSVMNPFRAKRGLTLAMLVGVITIAYPLLSTDLLGTVEQISIEGADTAMMGASGIYEKMQNIQRSFGYFLVVVPKALQLFFGLIPQISLSPDDFWNGFVLPAQCISYAGLILAAIFTRKLTVENDFFYLICIFLVVFVVTPVFAPRYLYPVAVLLAIWVSSLDSPRRRGNSPL